jgi:hypothetical protein
MKSFSVCVFVSSGEFSNMRSIVAATSAARPGSASLMTYTPARPEPNWFASSK